MSSVGGAVLFDVGVAFDVDLAVTVVGRLLAVLVEGRAGAVAGRLEVAGLGEPVVVAAGDGLVDATLGELNGRG